MPIRFALYQNPFKKQVQELIARVVPVKCVGEQDVFDRMLQRNNGLTASEILAVMEEYALALEYLLQEGYAVHTPLFKMDASIQGKFEGPDDHFDPHRHQIRLNLTPGPRLRKLLTRQKARRIAPSEPHPQINRFDQFDAQLSSRELRAGDPVQLRGLRLKINPQAPDEGVYFLSANGTEYKVDQLLTNEPRQLILMTPRRLPLGHYRVEVRCRVGNSVQLRCHTYPYQLQCCPSADGAS